MIPRGIIRMASLVFVEKNSEEFCGTNTQLARNTQKVHQHYFSSSHAKKALIFHRRFLDPPSGYIHYSYSKIYSDLKFEKD